MNNKQLLLLSSSNVHGYEYLQYAADDMKDLFERNRVDRVLFVPYALADHDAYTAKISSVLKQWGVTVEGIHKFEEAKDALEDAQAIFIGGGNTFLLLKCLYERDLLRGIRERVLNGTPYIGTSAGTNVATANICTTNDMPIVYPPSFEALRLVPFNINPHYLDSAEGDTHKGETREERILQYVHNTETAVVLAMREGCTLHVRGSTARLGGVNTARLYTRTEEPRDLAIGSDVSFLL